MIPTIGRIVHYTLADHDVAMIRERRGLYPHLRGNLPETGDVVPMMITKVWSATEGGAVNGQAYLDGNDVHWVTSTAEGGGHGRFKEPTRV